MSCPFLSISKQRNKGINLQQIEDFLVNELGWYSSAIWN